MPAEPQWTPLHLLDYEDALKGGPCAVQSLGPSALPRRCRCAYTVVMRTTALLLALSLAPTCAVASPPAEVAREEAVSAARAAAGGASLRSQQLSETPVEFALIWLTLPYANEPLSLPSDRSWFTVAALLREKRDYWSVRLEAAMSALPQPADLPDAFDSARAALRAEAAASAIRSILADIEADRAVLREPRNKFSPQDLLDRKSALFKRLSATRIP